MRMSNPRNSGRTTSLALQVPMLSQHHKATLTALGSDVELPSPLVHWFHIQCSLYVDSSLRNEELSCNVVEAPVIRQKAIHGGSIASWMLSCNPFPELGPPSSPNIQVLLDAVTVYVFVESSLAEAPVSALLKAFGSLPTALV